VQVPTSPRQVFDVTGAGDTFIAALTLAWWSGYTLAQAACVANAASGVVVGKIGSVPCTRIELEEALTNH
jgi:bifunctional ADP-heptose synthase (sugar kinase/adenylyltransferase)